MANDNEAQRLIWLMRAKAQIDRQLMGAQNSLGGDWDGKEWRLTGTLFVNPEVVCNYCHNPHPTGKVWLVHPIRKVLYGAWDLTKVTNGLAPAWSVPGEGFVHPHVSGGKICMGTADTVEAALWFGLYPASSYYSVPVWLRSLKHSCQGVKSSLEGREGSFEECNCCGEDCPSSSLRTYADTGDKVCEDCRSDYLADHGGGEFYCEWTQKWFTNDESSFLWTKMERRSGSVYNGLSVSVAKREMGSSFHHCETCNTYRLTPAMETTKLGRVKVPGKCKLCVQEGR